MKRRSSAAAHGALRQQVAREKTKKGLYKKRSESARRAAITRELRRLRTDLFGRMTHAERIQEIRNSTHDWAYFQELAERSAGWDTRRIRDEFFSPKVRGKR